MSAKAIRHRYQQVLDLLNEGGSMERWLLGELVRRTVEQEQDSAAVELEIQPRELRHHLITEAEAQGLELAKPAVAEVA